MATASERVLMVGRYPPPLGGNTVHIQRLSERLTADGFDVAVADVYRGALLSIGQQSEAELVTGLPRVLAALPRFARSAVAHFHISAGSNFYVAGPLLRALTSKAKRRVLTLHSGSWVKEFESLASWKRGLARRVLGSFDDIVCVNESQAEVIRSVVPVRAHVIPAFLPSQLDPSVRLPGDVEALRSQVDALLVTSGGGTPIYDYATVLRALSLIHGQVPVRLGLVIATYGKWEQPYWDGIESMARSSPVPVVSTKDLTPHQVLKLLSSSQIYVRATTTDGDAVAIREAASVGAQIVASDAARRPPGTALFTTGRAESLAKSLQCAVGSSEFGRVSGDVAADTYGALRQIYSR